MNLQLDDGSLENPIGLLENVTVKSCGTKYEHTFAIADFGQNANYEVILGRPFMRQFQMVQDWGYNYLYLRHETPITRVNLKDYSHRDVTHMPMEEFDSTSSKNSNSNEGEDRANLWMCGASQTTMIADGSDWRKEVENDAFVPVPYPEEKLNPVEWAHCLASIDVCSLNHGTNFCDEEGYDVVPIQMVQMVNSDLNEEVTQEREKFHHEEVSIKDLSLAKSADDEFCGEDLDEYFVVPESELEKIQILLRG